MAERIKELFEAVKREYRDVFEQDEKLLLDAKSIGYVVSQLQNYSLLFALMSPKDVMILCSFRHPTLKA